MKRKILVISEGPPPLGSTAVEGGGLRAWGLAKGLASNGHDVTFAYRSTFKLANDAKKTPIPDGVKVSTWDGTNIDDILSKHGVVVVRYAMGEAYNIVSKMTEDQILVSDNYIPISVEVSARRSSDPNEQVNYLRLQKTSLYTTRRADYILYASKAQFDYYIGYLSGINKLNPTTYDSIVDRMFLLPYGVDPDDKPALVGEPPENPTLLWYGAFYSWFDMESLIPALIKIKKAVPNFKLIIAGAKNPYNKDPGILAHYDKTMKALEPIKDNMESIPWGAFDERFDVYSKASAIITWNHTALENSYAWRTRLMDFVLAARPIITNGGDPLGEDLIQRGLAFRSSIDDIQKVFLSVVKNPPKQEVYEKSADDYSWNNITKPLSDSLDRATRMVSGDMEIKTSVASIVKNIIKRFVKLPIILVKSISEKGLKETACRILKKLKIVK